MERCGALMLAACGTVTSAIVEMVVEATAQEEEMMYRTLRAMAANDVEMT